MTPSTRIAKAPSPSLTGLAWVSACLLSLVFLCSVTQVKAHSPSGGPVADTPLQHLVVAGQSAGWALIQSAADKEHGKDQQDTPLAQFATNQLAILSANVEGDCACPQAVDLPAEPQFCRPPGRAPPIV
ncbi:MAG TPA: hypothetical protein VFM78_11935 [Marinobacter sp.]|jgi:hypothetical protein|nr:hypothetical protein [Marinobacter sp.]